MCDFLSLSLHSVDWPALEGVDFAHHFDQLGQRGLRQHSWDAARPWWLLGAVVVLPPWRHHMFWRMDTFKKKKTHTNDASGGKEFLTKHIWQLVISHHLPLEVCTLVAAADRPWPCDCLDEPAVPPRWSLCTFCRLPPDTESEGEAVDRWDWRKLTSIKWHTGFLPQTLSFVEWVSANLLDVKVSHAVAVGDGRHLRRVVADQLAQQLDGRGGSVRLPLHDAQLAEVGPRVTGQGLAVLKVEAAQLTGGVWWSKNIESYCQWLVYQLVPKYYEKIDLLIHSCF